MLGYGMNCDECHSAVCTNPHLCDDLVWVVPVIMELSRSTHLNPVEVRESLDDQIRLTNDEFFLLWKAAELIQKWRE